MREEEDNGAVNKNFVNLAIGYLDHLLKKEKKKKKNKKRLCSSLILIHTSLGYNWVLMEITYFWTCDEPSQKY